MKITEIVENGEGIDLHLGDYGILRFEETICVTYNDKIQNMTFEEGHKSKCYLLKLPLYFYYYSDV